MIIQFEGLVAFQNAGTHTNVFFPPVHGHDATLVAKSEGIELPSQPGADHWKPRFMFRHPGTNELQYLWDIKGPIKAGTGSTAAQLAGSQDLIMNFVARHQKCRFKGGSHGFHMELSGGEIRPFEASKACFVVDGAETEIAEMLEWEGPNAISSGNKFIKVDASATFVLSNSNPEPNGLRHLSHYYELFIQKDKGDQTPDLILTHCPEGMAAGAGNCVPNGIIP